MRQAGLKPKSHSSGVYWTRAASNGRGKKKQGKAKPADDYDPSLDYNGDGVVNGWDTAERWFVRIGVFCWIVFMIVLARG